MRPESSVLLWEEEAGKRKAKHDISCVYVLMFFLIAFITIKHKAVVACFMLYKKSIRILTVACLMFWLV